MTGADILNHIKPADLPSPPQAAIQIMRACSQPEVNHHELSRLASSDPLLTAELLRVVNSPYFGLSREVQSIPRAVTVLGQRALRNLALCVSVRDALKEDVIPGFDLAPFWEDSIRRAVAARLLGEKSHLDPDDCFAGGLLQDFGLLVMFYLHPERAHDWPDMRTQDPDMRYGTELGWFHTTHDRVGMQLAQTWELPGELAEAIGSHHQCPDDNPSQTSSRLCRILHCADWMAAVYAAHDKAHTLEHTRSMLSGEFALDTQAAEELLQMMPALVKEAAEALGLGVAEQPDFGHVMLEANAKLAEANLSYQELTWRLEKTLRERDELQAELNKELNLAREIQQSMLPTSPGEQFPISGINLSARQLSGDFFDYFPIADGRIYFNLGDVSGKGVNAALLMEKTSSLFRCLGKTITNPSELLARINDELCETSTRGMFVTLCAGLYDPHTDGVDIVNAGHVPAILVGTDGKFGKLEALAPPLGVVSGSEFPKKHLSLKGGSLYVFSDGVTEGRLADGNELGLKGLLHLLGSLANEQPQQRLKTIAKQFTVNAAPLRDDLTLLVIQNRRK